jgi:hypothetical protein
VFVCWSCTGELAKGSVAAQAKARSTLETDELHKPVDTQAVDAAISKHLHLLAGNKRAVQTAACESPRCVTTGRDALVGSSGTLFWAALAARGSLAATASLCVPDCC